MSTNSEVEERFIAQKQRDGEEYIAREPRDAEEYLDCAGRPFDQAQGRRVRRSERGRKSRPAPLGMTGLGRVAKETKSKMRCFVFGFCAVLVLTFGPGRVVSAQQWWGHSGPGPMGAGADQKAEKQHAQKTQFEKPTPIYTSPRSVGWWHKSPAPMGSGADTIPKLTWPNIKSTWPHIRKAQLEKPTPLYKTPKSVGWWQKSPGPAGAGSGN